MRRLRQAGLGMAGGRAAGALLLLLLLLRLVVGVLTHPASFFLAFMLLP